MSLQDIPLGAPVAFTLDRGTPGAEATFTRDSLQALVGNITEHLLTQVSKQWEISGKAPAHLTVEVRCDVR